MKTLYYKIEMRVPQIFLNTGIVKVEIDKEQKIKMIGVLTEDVFIGEEKDGMIWFRYFVCNYEESCFDETFVFAIQVEEFWKKLGNIKLPKKTVLKDEVGTMLIINIEEKIQNQLKKEECNRKIDEIINVFENES